MGTNWLLSVLLVPALLSAQETRPSPWHDDFAKAKEVAKEKNRPILAYFTGSDWQKYCLQFQADVLQQKEFLEWAERTVVLLVLDRPRDKKLPEATAKQTDDLMATYKVTVFPTIVVLDAEGKVKARMVGLVSG